MPIGAKAAFAECSAYKDACAIRRIVSLPNTLKVWINMKSQQRTFVVEIKSARRRSTNPTASIWADTDLRALVRKAEEEAPHLFEPNIVSTTPGQDEQRPEPRPQTPLTDSAETEDDVQIPVSLVEAEQALSPLEGNDPAFGSVPQSEEGSSERRSPRMSKRRPKASVNRQADSSKSAPRVRSTTAQVEAPLDELVALDEENRRLKGLLAKHLLLQNMRLRKMLARFAVI